MLTNLNKLRTQGYSAAFVVEEGFFNVLIAFDRANFMANVRQWRSARPDGAAIDIGTHEIMAGTPP